MNEDNKEKERIQITVERNDWPGLAVPTGKVANLCLARFRDFKIKWRTLPQRPTIRQGGRRKMFKQDLVNLLRIHRHKKKALAI